MRMIGSKPRRSLLAQWKGPIAIGMLALLALPGSAAAQAGDPTRPRLRLPDATTLAEVSQADVTAAKWQGPQPGASAGASRLQTSTTTRERSVTKRILGGAVGAVGGFFAGGYLGAMIEGNDCNCDDPGLKGALIGAPVGAVAGGVLGALFLF
jgi:hypothetical protein